MNSKKKYLSIGAGLAIGSGLGILILFGLGGWDAWVGSGRSNQNAYGSSAPAPDFTLETLDGAQVRLSDFKGQVVVLNFWATWCVPCKEEMPYLEARYQRYAPNLVVLAINFAEPLNAVKAYVDELGLTFEILLDPQAFVQEMYEVRGYPTSVFIDTEGIIRSWHIGVMTEKQLDEYLVQSGIPLKAGQESRSW